MRRAGAIFAFGIAALCAVLLAGCAVGPNYKRPPVAAPAAFRNDTDVTTNSFANLPWWQIFHDETLQNLVRVALTNNYDLRIAVARVEQEQAILAEARSEYYPQVNYAAEAGRGKNVSGGSPAPDRKSVV